MKPNKNKRRPVAATGAKRSGWSPAKYTLKQKFILLFLSLFICFILTELAARFWLYHLASPEKFSEYALYEQVDPQRRMFSPHHYLNYQNTPNFKSKSGLNKHNSLGYRGEEIATPKPKDTFRIVALGGSSTYTIKVDDHTKSYPALLEKTLREDHGYENIEVINAGVGGYNSWESLINLEFRVLDLDPDLIIVYHGLNDAHSRFVTPASYRPDNSGQRKQWSPPPRGFWEKSTLLRIINRKTDILPQGHTGLEGFVNADTSYLYFAGDPDEALQKNPPVYFQKNLTSIAAIAAANNIDLILATWAYSPLVKDYTSAPFYRKAIADNNRIVKNVAQSTNAKLFDFAKQMPPDKKYWQDARHVNEDGAQLKATIFADFINKNQLIPKQ